MKLFYKIKEILSNIFKSALRVVILLIILSIQGTLFTIYFAIEGKPSEAILSFIVPTYGIIAYIGTIGESSEKQVNFIDLKLEDKKIIIEDSIGQINKNLPIKYNNIVREKVDFDYSKMQIINKYSLLRKEDILRYKDNNYKKNIIKENKEFLCDKNSSTLKLNENGVGFKYIYYDINKEVLFNHTIKPNEC